MEIYDIQELLNSEYHDMRVIALTILTDLYNKKTTNKKDIVDFYLVNTKNINNWDLVDISAYKIVGDYILKYNDKNYDILKKLSKFESLWVRRISIISTMAFVKNGYLDAIIEISKTLLKNEHDLINKAVGWLLRELGKKNEELLVNFLKENINDISSVTLSYSMEKFDKNKKDKIRSMRKKAIVNYILNETLTHVNNTFPPLYPPGI